MKEDIFKQYLDAIAKVFRVPKEVIVSNSKDADAVEARQLLYYLCFQRQMRMVQIQRFMTKEGYDPGRPGILKGIRQATKKVDTDPDYQTVTDRINNNVFI